MVAYETAYLKKYYPIEFFAAMLTSVMGNNEKVAFYIDSCKKNGIAVLPPDINESNVTFTVSKNRIRFGLAAVKNVGKSAIMSIIISRKKVGKFLSFTDFCRKIANTDLNKKAVESLIKIGAFDSLGSYRSQLLAIYENVIDGISQNKKRNLEGQISMFEMANSSMDSTKDVVPAIKEFERKYLLAMEKEMTGLYLSGHPLMEYTKELDISTTINTSEIFSSLDDEQQDISLENIELDNKSVIIGGIIALVKIKATRNNSLMAFITLEDMYGSIEVLIFPKVYERYNKIIHEDNIVLIKGRISIREEESPKLLAEKVEPLKKINDKLYLKVSQNNNNEVIQQIKPILSSSKGHTPVYLCIEDSVSNKKSIMAAGPDLWVDINENLLKRLYELLGEESVKIC